MRKSVAALGCSLVLLVTACGSDGSTAGSDTTTAATATTSTAAPVPTSSAPSSTMPASTSPATTASTQPATTEPIETDPPVTEPASTDAPTTVDTTPVATTESTATADTAAVTSTAPAAEYTPVDSPPKPTATAVVTDDDVHPDGVYYASVSEDGDAGHADGSVVFELVQLFTGDDCTAHFGADDEDACVNDYGVETEPTSSIEVPLADVFISVVDPATQQSYQISGAEFSELLLGELPSEGAPADYLYTGFGYLVTYEGGVITRLEQWWTP